MQEQRFSGVAQGEEGKSPPARGAQIHLRPIGDPTPEEMDVSRRKLQPTEPGAHPGAGVLVGSGTTQKLHSGAACS